MLTAYDPLGNHCHGMGTGISFAAAEDGQNESLQKRLRKGSYIAIELNTRTLVPDWENEAVYIMLEDPAYLTDEGWKFFRPRQEKFYLVE